MSGLDKVKEELMKVIEKEVQDYTDEVYRSGHEDGVKSVQLLGNRARDIGREEAWECAKSIINFALDKRDAIFGADNSVWSILNYCSASEAMQKIKDYEEENVKKCGKCLISYNGASCSSCEEERQTEEIKVGDEVKVYDDCIGIVTRHAPQARTCYVMYRDGSCGEEELTDCKKTGNHSMSLDKWLEQMRKESE